MLFSQNTGMRIVYSIPVFLLFGCVGGLYYCYLYGFLLVMPIANAIVSGIFFHVFLILLIWSYIMSVVTDPGTTPKDFEPTQSDFPQENLNEDDLKHAKVTICKICNTKRPPRTHHCQHCDRCVLRRDHHCPWVANCVGFYNHRYFIQFITYTTLSSIVLCLSCLSTLTTKRWDYNIQSLVGFIMGVLITLGIGGFASFHYYLLFTNVTSTEYKPTKYFNVFNTSTSKSNCAQVCGKSLIGYILPIRTSYGIDPTLYPLRLRNTLNEVLYYENKLIV